MGRIYGITRKLYRRLLLLLIGCSSVVIVSSCSYINDQITKKEISSRTEEGQDAPEVYPEGISDRQGGHALDAELGEPSEITPIINAETGMPVTPAPGQNITPAATPAPDAGSGDITAQGQSIDSADNPEPKPSAVPNDQPEPKPTQTPAGQPEPKPAYTPTTKPESKSSAAPTAKPTPRPKATPAPQAVTTPLPKELTADIKEYAEEILKSIISKGMKEVDQVRAVHDYIILNTAYYEDSSREPSDYPDYVFNVEGVLLKGKAVCQGYAETFQLFMELLGIDSKFVVGRDLTSNIGHAWNMVRLEGKWYHVDVTWDDPIPDQKGRIQYKYFLVTDQVLARDHGWEKSNYPACNSVDYRYYIYEDCMIASLDDYEDKFIELYLKGERTITILYPEEGRPDMRFFFDYEYLYTVDKDGSKHISYNHFPTWRLGDYTVYTVMVE